MSESSRLRQIRLLKGSLTALTGFFLLASVLMVWADRVFFNRDGFTVRASVAMEQGSVQHRLAEIIAAELSAGRPKLESAQTVVVAATEWVLASSEFQELMEEAAGQLHSQLFSSSDRSVLALRIREIALRVRQVLEVLAPELAAELPQVAIVEARLESAHDLKARVLRITRSVDLLALVLPLVTLGLAATMLFVSTDRRRTLSDLCIAAALVAAIILGLLFLGRLVLVESIQHSENVEAVKAIWGAFMRPLSDVAWVLLALGVATLIACRYTLVPRR